MGGVECHSEGYRMLNPEKQIFGRVLAGRGSKTGKGLVKLEREFRRPASTLNLNDYPNQP